MMILELSRKFGLLLGCLSRPDKGRFRRRRFRTGLAARCCRCVGRHLRSETFEPGDQCRMLLAPMPLEAKITVAKQAGKRDFADGRNCAVRRRRLLEHSERAANLTALPVHP